jgi:glucose-6-phosphate dehydrogenase assembly protein OpcA
VTAAVPPSTQRHTHVSGLHAVASALDDLHRDAIREAGAESTQVRLSVLNIVAACNDAALIEGAIDSVVTVAERHPARAIVIHADRTRAQMIESDISLRRSPAGSYIELVRLEIGGEPALHLTSIVQPLLIPDIPVHLWVVGAPPLDQAFNADAVSLNDRLILDSAAFDDTTATLQLIAGSLERYGPALQLSDMAWERMRPWREAVAHAFNGPAVRDWLRDITGVDIVSVGTRSAPEAWLFAGWLASRLGWSDAHMPDITMSTVPQHEGIDLGLVHCRIRCRRGRHDARIDVEQRGGVLRTDIDIDAGVVASRAVIPRRVDDGLLIARLMAETDDDVVYRQVVARAAAMAAHG